MCSDHAGAPEMLAYSSWIIGDVCAGCFGPEFNGALAFARARRS